MCPDRQLLSVYIDQELPSPWKEKLEAHLSQCPTCSDRASRYRAFSNALRQQSAGDTEDAKARVWKALHRTVGSAPATIPFPSRPRRGVNIPIPVAVAAVLVVAITAAFVGGPLLSLRNQDQTMARIGTEVPGVIPVSDMASVLQYLEAQNSSTEIVIIRLPETRSFISSGEPALVRAADYTRRIGP